MNDSSSGGGFSFPDALQNTAFPIARPGLPFLAAAAFTTFVLALLELTALALIGLCAFFFIAWFFRDPDRPIPSDPGAVVSPADGKVIYAGEEPAGPYYDRPCVRVSIFMNIFNVHVNRAPLSGTVREIRYTPGKFLNAAKAEAGTANERNALFVTGENGEPVTVVQVAGLVARRIICNVTENDSLVRGGRYGMICFGSRLDVYLPENVSLSVEKGDKVSAGTTVLGVLKDAAA